MRRLTHVNYAHTQNLTEEVKDELMIPTEYKGLVAIETWEVNGKLQTKGICIQGVVNYIKGLGDFKEDEDE